MKRLMIRKPEVYERMREASFTPGVWMTLFVALILYVAEYILREIPANILDISYYSQHTYHTDAEALRTVRDYITSPWTMIAALLITSVMIIVTLVYVRGIEKRPVSTIGLIRKGLFGNFAAGYAMGLCLLAIAVIPELTIRTAEYRGVMPVTAAFFFAFIVQAASEEVYFRGFMLSSLSAKGKFIPAVLITSTLFAFMHLGNYGVTLFYILDIFVSGILYAFYTLRTGSLWGAIGMHAAWNFALGLVSPTITGGLVTNYSVFKAGPINDSSIAAIDLFNLGYMVLELIVIAFVLFAGENRLVVKMNEERRMYLDAIKIAKRSLKGLPGEDGRPLLRRAVGVSNIAEAETVKAAALLYAARSGGNAAAEELAGYGFSGNVLNAVEELLKSPKGMVSKEVKEDPIALAVVTAGVKYDDEHAGDKSAKRTRGKASLICPLLRREIDNEYCKSIVQSIDEGEDGGVLDTRICKDCPNRNVL